MTKKEQKLFELKLTFNDIAMREMGLDVDEEDHVYDIETESVYTIKDKFIKYSDEPYPTLMHNEMDLNLLENPRLMEILFGMWIQRRAERKGIEITSYYPALVQGSNRGFFVLTYIVYDEPREKKSDVFVNESVQIFDLICKINHTTHIYKAKLPELDIEIKRKDGK